MKATERRSLRLLPVAILSAVVLLDHDVGATDMTIAVEVSTPPATAGVDAAGLRDAAEGEIRQLDPTRLPNRRRVVVSLAVTRAAIEGPVMCTVNATLRDARTGTMIAIIEAGAQAEGPGSTELRKQVAHEAIKRAVQRIPRALGGK